MSVRTRILLSLLFVSAVFVGAIWMVRQDQAEYFIRLVEARVTAADELGIDLDARQPVRPDSTARPI